MRHLLVTNDFPPKLGGIQSYLWELWRRLPAEDTVVLTTPYEGDAAFDADQSFTVVRSRHRVLLPAPSVRHEVLAVADRTGAELVLLDPALPLGLIGPSLGRRYAVVLHGAEITVPGRVPGARRLLARVLEGAVGVVAAGGYPADEGERAVGHGLPVVLVPPGVDPERFRPLSVDDRRAARRRLGVADDALLVTSVSRLVPRKGMDVLVEAVARLAPRHPDLEVLIGGAGRDRRRLERLVARTGAPVRLVGRVADDDLPRFVACADVFAMLCRGNRWAGLEQEGFGIVFLEAAAGGVPQVAGRSGGAAEAVVDGVTGLVVDEPRSVDRVVDALEALLADPVTRVALGDAARERAATEFGYDLLASRLAAAIDRWADAP